METDSPANSKCPAGMYCTDLFTVPITSSVTWLEAAAIASSYNARLPT